MKIIPLAKSAEKLQKGKAGTVVARRPKLSRREKAHTTSTRRRRNSISPPRGGFPSFSAVLYYTLCAASSTYAPLSLSLSLALPSHRLTHFILPLIRVSFTRIRALSYTAALYHYSESHHCQTPFSITLKKSIGAHRLPSKEFFPSVTKKVVPRARGASKYKKKKSITQVQPILNGGVICGLKSIAAVVYLFVCDSSTHLHFRIHSGERRKRNKQSHFNEF